MAADPTKARLLDAAGEEFAEKGFEGATVRAICERARANVAAVNYHFGDKEQLYIQAVIEAHRCGMEGDGPEDVPGSPEERLRHFVGNFLERVLAVTDRESWHHKLMLREMIRPTRASEALVREVIRPKFNHLQALLRDLDPEGDDRRLLALAFSVIGQCLHYKMSRPISERLAGTAAFASLLDLNYLTDHITGVTLAALGIGPGIARHAPAGGGPA